MILQLLAVAAAVLGNHWLITQSAPTVPIARGVVFLLLGFALWLAAEALSDGPELRYWLPWQRRDRAERGASRPPVPGPRLDRDFLRSHRYRIGAALLGLLGCGLAYQYTAGNHFSLVGFWSWLASIALWAYALAERGDGPADWLRDLARKLRRLSWRDPLLLLLLAIVLVASIIRLNDLPGVLPELNSDQVEAILSGYEVAEGARPVIFTRDGGREPFHFYAMALLAQVPGLGHSQETFKLITMIWAVLALPCLYWLGWVVIGDGSPQLGRRVGLAMVALAAVGYWHIVLSLVGHRWTMLLAPGALLLIFLVRAIREKRRGEYLKAGLVLGFCLYIYPSARILPLAVVFSVGLAFLFWARGGRARLGILVNLGALALLSFVIFVPLFRFANDQPELFWYRAAKLVLDRGPAERSRIPEFLTTAAEQVPLLVEEILDSAFMFHWKGDIQLYRGAPHKPVLGTWLGAFFMVGLAAWLGRMLRRRDAFDWALPGLLLILMLPSMLSLAVPEENPSNTRTVASLPIVYLISALPLATLLGSLWESLRRRHIALAGVACGAILLPVLVGGFQISRHRYYDLHREAYLPYSKPHSEFGRVLRELADELGFGNVAIYSYPHWLDHRAVALEAGEFRWDNASFWYLFHDPSRQQGRFPVNPERDLVLFLHPDDKEGRARLRKFFPGGELSDLIVSYQPEDSYYLFRAPAEELADYLARERGKE